MVYLLALTFFFLYLYAWGATRVAQMSNYENRYGALMLVSAICSLALVVADLAWGATWLFLWISH
jgi:hypothetical protein